jgi:hypothetical protein
MKCPHTETTAVLAAFGEAPPEFEAHIATCSACREAVQEHISTLAHLQPLREPARKTAPRWNRYAAGFLMAATVLLAVQFPSTNPIEPVQQRTTAATPMTDTIEPFHDSLDDDLASLELALDLYYLEES